MGSQVCGGEGTDRKSGAWMKEWMRVIYICLFGSDPHQGWVLGEKGVSGRGGRGAEVGGGLTERMQCIIYVYIYAYIHVCTCHVYPYGHIHLLAYVFAWAM